MGNLIRLTTGTTAVAAASVNPVVACTALVVAGTVAIVAIANDYSFSFEYGKFSSKFTKSN